VSLCVIYQRAQRESESAKAEVIRLSREKEVSPFYLEFKMSDRCPHAPNPRSDISEGFKKVAGYAGSIPELLLEKSLTNFLPCFVGHCDVCERSQVLHAKLVSRVTNPLSPILR
jgi:hypothetical protein